MKLIRSMVIAMFAIAVVFGGATNASAYNINDDHRMFGLYQLWINLDTDAAVVTDAATGNTSGDSLFGIRERRIFFGVAGKLADGALGYYLLQSMGGPPSAASSILAWGSVFLPGLQVDFGKLAPMVTYDGSIQGSGSLLSLQRATPTLQMTGAPYAGGTRAWRDLGLRFIANAGPAQIRVTVTNGVGDAAQADSEHISGQLAQSNQLGQAMYGIGAIIKPADGVRVHAAFTSNKHDDVKLSTGSVIDIDRTSTAVGGKVSMGAIMVDGEYATTKATSSDFGGESELKGFWVRGGYSISKDLLLSVRHASFERVTLNTKDTDLTVALMHTMGNLKTTIEYVTTDGEAGSVWGATDPKLLRMQLQMGF